MSSVTANRLKKGMLIKMGDDLLRVFDTHHLTQGNKRAHMQAKMRDIRTGRIVDHKFRAEEDVERAILEEHEMQFLYKDGSDFVFMDQESYDQSHVSPAALGDAADYLVESAVAIIATYQGDIVSVEIPASVELVISETEPGVQGDRVSGATKPATLETGKVIKVPLFVNTGDKVKVDTRTGDYITRV